MIAGSPPGDSGIRVLGAVRGYVPDAEAVRDALDRFAPLAVGVAASPEELEGFRDSFETASTEPLVNLYPNEASEARQLARFGEVHLPRPAVDETLRWASARRVPVTALDPPDAEYGEMFTEYISYFDLVGRTLRERRLTRRPPTASTVEALALLWDARLNGRRGSRRLAEARERLEAEGILQLRLGASRVAAVVDRERFEGVLEAVQAKRMSPAR